MKPMELATLDCWSSQTVHYMQQKRQLESNDYAEHTRLALKWHRITLNKIRVLMANGSYVRKLWI